MTGESIENQTVLVTGGAGFIGSHLVDALVANNTVRVLDDISTGERDRIPDEATLIEADLRDEDALARAADGVDLIFHEAAQVSVDRSVEDPLPSHRTNAGGTVALLEAARRADARVVAASSCAIYGHPETVPISEDHPTNPPNPYAADKLTLDHYVRLYDAIYDLPTVALRYFNVYGPRQSGGQYSGVIGIFRRQAREGGPLTVEGDGSQTRDFVHVSDVVQANLRAARTDATGAAYNVGTGEETSILELAEAVQEAANRDVDIEHVEPRPADIEQSRADLSKVREQLDYEQRVDLESGIANLLQES